MSTSLPPAFSLGPVSTLQEMLRTIAFVNRSLPFLRPTGRFDEETLEAVMMFQKINGFPVTGIVDRRTWDAIMNAPHCHHFFPRCGTDPPRPKFSPTPSSPRYVPCIG